MNPPTPEPTTAPLVIGSFPHRAFRPEPRAGRSRARPSGLIGAVALVVVIEWAVAHAGPKFLEPIAADWALCAASSKTDTLGCDVIFAGDSQMKHGLIPRIVDEVSGHRSYNLAASASSVPATEALLRSAFDAGARPRVVVLDFKPNLFLGGPRFQLTLWPQILGMVDLGRLIVEAKSLPFTTELLLNVASPTLRSRHEIRENVKAALRGEISKSQRVNAVNTRNWTVNRGANVSFRPEGYDGAVTETEQELYLSKGFHPHRINTASLRRAVALIQAHGARVYVLLAPNVPEIQARRALTGADAKYEAFVRSLQDEMPDLTVLDARSSGYPASAFVDPIHLAVIGSLPLSADVGEILRADLDGHGPGGSKRWVRLPPFRARPIPADLEDLNHSSLKVDAAAAK